MNFSKFVALLVALERRVEVALLGQALDGAQLPRVDLLARPKQPVGPDVHARRRTSDVGWLVERSGIRG